MTMQSLFSCIHLQHTRHLHQDIFVSTTYKKNKNEIKTDKEDVKSSSKLG